VVSCFVLLQSTDSFCFFNPVVLLLGCLAVGSLPNFCLGLLFERCCGCSGCDSTVGQATVFPIWFLTVPLPMNAAIPALKKMKIDAFKDG